MTKGMKCFSCYSQVRRYLFYFPSTFFPERYTGGITSIILHLCSSPWNQLWCQSNVATNGVSAAPPLRNLCGWKSRCKWCCLFEPFYQSGPDGSVLLLCANMMIYLVCMGYNRRKRPSSPLVRGSNRPFCDIPTTSNQNFIAMHVSEWMVYCWCTCHAFLEGPLDAPGNIVSHCLRTTATQDLWYCRSMEKFRHCNTWLN